ncbi:hypothetical protein NUU61_002286 [Penicillium alfredii]|uniref:Palmitoyltransferase n=1 Tax=Penicillium alfredii TaxID=1506179 RepID=A0A9W9KFU4_9EURO|nr:uncharacterized protein NUU61_002286 [Penicillium alfredii]KAJ5104939.1 hypothetical protein NUU61_002286 [Penicillium alfredii]
MATPAQKRVNVAVSRVIPPVLLGAVVYASYAVTKPLCIDYLIHPLPSYDRAPRVGAGAAILAVYYVLLIPMVVTYLRLLYYVAWEPGYLPLGAERIQQDAKDAQDSESEKPRRRKSSSRKPQEPEKNTQPDADTERGLDTTAGGKAFQLDPLGLERFYTKDVFVCQPDGRPPYCSSCCQFKTDRAHHCREVDRCVRKMDHFCPWVGGVVSETSFKFFVQFVAYTFVFCLFALIVSAYFTAELRHHLGEINAHWCICIGLSGLFGVFTLGMTLSSLQLAMFNLTTIENLNRRSAVWTLAIRVPDHLLDQLWASESPWAPNFRMPQTSEPSTKERHVFAILQTQPGDNPFNLGSPLANLQQVMGYSVADWLLPLKQSPCADHSSLESAFALGPVVARLKQEAGLVAPSPNGSGCGSATPTG